MVKRVGFCVCVFCFCFVLVCVLFCFVFLRHVRISFREDVDVYHRLDAYWALTLAVGQCVQHVPEMVWCSCFCHPKVSHGCGALLRGTRRTDCPKDTCGDIFVLPRRCHPGWADGWMPSGCLWSE